MTAKVYHVDVWGTREEKYEWLRTHTLGLPRKTLGLPRKSAEGEAVRAGDPPADPVWVPLFQPASWPEALPVSPDVYRGVCRVIVQIEQLHSMQAVASSRLAVQVAAHLGEDAAAEWIAEDEARYLEGLRTGLRPVETRKTAEKGEQRKMRSAK